MKNFIKNNLKVFVTMIITTIIVGSVSVYAASQYFARDISFTPTNENFKKENGEVIDNVEDALNQLYGGIIKGEILLSEDIYDSSSLTSKTYEFSEKRNAILIVNVVHGNNNSSYNHQLNEPSIVNGQMKQLYSIGKLNSQVSGGEVISEYAYLISANEKTTITIDGKAYGWGHYRIKLIG